MAPKEGPDDRTIRLMLPQLTVGNAKNRGGTLDELISVFDRTNRTVNISSLKSETYHIVLEAVFACTLNERHSYLTSKAKAKSSTTLSKCAKVVRSTVAAGVHRLRRKTVEAVVEHITQTLPMPTHDGKLFEPLAHDYIRALDTICAEQFQAERLAIPPDDGDEACKWEVAVDFCLDHILAMSASDESGSTPVLSSSANCTASTASSRFSTVRNSQQRQNGGLLILLQCLWNLVRVENAPIQQKAGEISSGALQVLQLKALSLSQLQPCAFSIINRVLAVTQADDLKFANGLAVDLVPLITYWWQGERTSSKDAFLLSLRDELLKTIYISHLHLDHLLLHSSTSSVSLLTDIDRLSTLLLFEYCRRGNDTRLQLENLTFTLGKSSDGSMKTLHFGLRPHDIEAERHWAVLECMSILEGLVARTANRCEQSPPTDLDVEQPRKRRRVERETSRLQQRLRSNDSGPQITTLQLLPFLAWRRLLTADELADLVPVLITLMGHKNGVIASWAMVACASCVVEMKVSVEADKALLQQAWHMAARSISLPSVCRAACVLLSAVMDAGLPYRDVSEDINNIVTQNGPATLVDSSIGLMTRLFHLRNVKLPGANQATYSHVIRWIFSRWKPDDFIFASQVTHVPLVNLAGLLRACCGHQQPLDRGPGALPIGPVGSTRISQLEKDSLLRYLLLLDGASQSPCAPNKAESPSNISTVVAADPSSHLVPKKLIMELLWPKMEDLEQLCDSWTKALGESNTPVSPERLDSLIFTCLAAAMILPQLSDLKSSKSDNIGNMVTKLVENSLGAALPTDHDRSLLELVLRRVHQSLPHISSSALTDMVQNDRALCKTLAAVSEALEAVLGRQCTDMMDLDETDLNSQVRNASSVSRTTTFPRSRVSGGLYLPGAFVLSTTMRLHLLGALGPDLAQAGHVPETFVDKLTQDVSSENILSCHELIFEILGSDLVLDPTLAGHVLDRVVAVMQEDPYEGSELALSFCLDVLCLVRNIWIDAQGYLGEMAEHLYLHFTEKLLRNNMLSPAVQRSLADLLFAIMSVNPNYATGLPRKRGHKPSSPRIFLLSILRNGPMVVKFSIGNKIAHIFDLFVLKLHDDVFVDILNNLPTDADMIEGMALRLLILANLACRWPTLLRRCTYHIFETPGRTGGFVEYATRCVSEMSSALALESPRNLFDLFAPQLLYTWLERDSLQSIPYSIFGFDSLVDLLRLSQAEALALMVMRGQEENIVQLTQILGDTRSALVQRNLARVLAYSIAHDESVGNAEKTRGDEWARKQLKKEVYMETVYASFVDIVAIFFGHIDRDEQMERYFAKAGSLDYAERAMLAMKEIAHSPVLLPPTQQPMFKAKYLINQLLYICNKTEFEFERLWRPALVVSVARRLFNTVHPALGTLHACSVLRKIRVLIAFAGDAAYTGYPLQMFLHCLRPFMLDTESADDAIGISQYLIANGHTQLTEDPSFLAGYSLSTLASLRVFLESSQSSTTQESQFKATMAKAQRFHSWFSSYLEEYDCPAFDDDAYHSAFRAITQSASRIRSSGNAERGTAESDLLLNILRDGDREKPLLVDSAKDLALDMLCGDFELPSRSQLDIIEADGDAVGHASLVWGSCRGEALSDSYLAWAGRVVGRSFAASGDVPSELLRESKLAEYLKIASGLHGSEQAVLRRLEVLTGHKISSTAGMAESAIRYIVSSSAASQDTTLLEAGMMSLTPQLIAASDWSHFMIPVSDVPIPPSALDEDVFDQERICDEGWLPKLATYLLDSVLESTMLAVLSPLVAAVKGFAGDIFPFVTHLVLQAHLHQNVVIKRKLEVAMRGWFLMADSAPREHIGLLINTILYLRSQPFPGEKCLADRSAWLDIDYGAATKAASSCGMYKIALLFAEIASHAASAKAARASKRRSSAAHMLDADSAEALLEIFENIDDPDAYYGLPEDSSLTGVLARLEYENNAKGLVFRGTQLNSHMRLRDPLVSKDMQSMVKSLGSLALYGVSHSLLQSRQDQDDTAASIGNTFQTARKLEIWNLPAPPSTDNPTVTIYRTYQTLSRAADTATVQDAIRHGFGQTMKRLASGNLNAASIRNQLGALATLTELDELVHVSGAAELDEVHAKFERRNQWMRRGRYEDVNQLLSCRETSLTMLSKQPALLTNTNLSVAEARRVQVKAMLLASGVYRFHEASQESLDIATTLNDLTGPCRKLGLEIDAAVKMEVANSLWDHKEMMPSISILQDINEDPSSAKQAIPINSAEVLSKIGHRVSVARLETPEEIQRNWLGPALKALGGQHTGSRAGQVFHQFAVFCDQQLQNPDSIEDLARLNKLRQAKLDEVKSLQQAFLKIKFRTQQEANHWRSSHIGRAESWFKLDDQEVKRVQQSRAEFMRLCLENYLLSLAASDDHNNDALRFTSLWIERSNEDFANAAVHKHIEGVPTRKFANIMNQLSSRLQNRDTEFQNMLLALVVRICIDHPFHGMYQIWTGTKTKVVQQDEVSVLRHEAMGRVVMRLIKFGGATADTWAAVDRTSVKYVQLAAEPAPSDSKARRQKVTLNQSKAFQILAAGIVKYKIPPPTMQIEVRADKDYSQIPRMENLEPTFSYAGGVSAPKIVAAIGTDGQRYKQLIKGSKNDDLRQDAIMEQVFGQVSSLLKLHRKTQQRQLTIRTYKVLPLTATAGLIEFVANTIPLHEWLLPAHERYRPNDLRPNDCRKQIGDVGRLGVDARLKVFRSVTAKFIPVMRYFFLEHFSDPDDWFVRRLAYTRTTAAISILGHVLGVGDRHGHNILLDAKTGEVVHIDLGISFEMGRVLPIPELVPFRLTRDIVDGMGITGTEGVFRRCCEFTLAALRDEAESIMSILDVLRYDPLYQWSISPARMQRLQDARRAEENATAGGIGLNAGTLQETMESTRSGRRGRGIQPSMTTTASASTVAAAATAATATEDQSAAGDATEADRALEVVKRKLTQTLSVEATVYDLINQARDEKNLAVLFSGWAAYV